jgi:hypothetical protein
VALTGRDDAGQELLYLVEAETVAGRRIGDLKSVPDGIDERISPEIFSLTIARGRPHKPKADLGSGAPQERFATLSGRAAP